MKSKLKKITYLFISLLMALLLNNTLIFNNGAQTELSIPKQSAGYSESFIHVDGNWSDTTSYDWCYGSGTWQEPYVIENVTIDASTSPIGSGILIENSQNAYFIVRNCTITNANGASGHLNYAGGIKLINCSNGVINNNNCSNGATYGCGILAYEGSFNITISENTVQNNGRHGILAADMSYNLSITGNNVTYTSNQGIYLYNGCYNVTVDNNNAKNNGVYGIYLNLGCHNNTIIGNNASGNHDGIYLYDSDNNTIQGNTANDNLDEGIDLNQYCDYNRVIGNIANNNPSEGIQLYSGSDFNIVSGNNVSNNDNGIRLNSNCRNNTILNNNASYNRNRGIYLNTDSDDNNITENTVNDNILHGIEIYSSDFNNIFNNTAYNNIGQGIYLRDHCDFNNITENTVNDNTGYGIYLNDHCEFNNITENTVNDNTGHGIFMVNCNFNNISENTVNDNTDTGIHLYFNSDHNLIKNNTINRNDLGIGLYWSDYNNISGNSLIDNSWCIYENEQSLGNIIEYNDCSPPTVQEPIFINDAATGVGAHNWTWAKSQSWCSGSGTWNDPYVIENLKIKGFEDENGIEIWNSNVSFIIQDCLIYNSNYGIYLENVNNSRLINNNCSNLDWGIHLEYSNNNTISGNTANGNEYEGIYLTECTNNTLSGNTVNDNLDEGIHLTDECVNNIITGNTANNNGYSGISLEEDSNNNTISGNNVNINTDYGIYLYYCDYNTISNNFVNNTGNFGISIHYSGYNTISDNIANYNGDIGIQLYDDNSNNTISNNVVKYNGLYGIGILENSDNNILTENILYNNTIGVYIDNSDNNSIYKNFFLENGKHAEDYGPDNKWNSTTIGNYWDNWTSPDVSPNDGIVDAPYTFIGGSPGSIDYFPIADDNAPSITINSPSDDDVFGVTAPSFNVTITDDYLYEMWYTLDGGLHNYTFTEFTGTIDQPAWDAILDVSVTLTFYASDKPGNIEFADVNIVKDTTNPIIVINSPTGGTVFGTNAPSYDVTITDDYLDEMWYTLDGGLHNFTFTDNGTLVQSAWAAVSDGTITLRFYAKDIVDNVGFAAVNITKDSTSPIIIINSPTDGDVFGVTAPSFNVTITDDQLDSMWYSLDGGLTTYAITTNDGSINQTAWATLSEGSITITFYANNTLGNLSFEEVTVTKSIPSGDVDPIIIITIVVVSIAGGVAVAAVIFVYLKKRASPK